MLPRTAAAAPHLPADYFEFFGLERKLSVDLRDLEKRFYQLSRQWHPDLFARKSRAERQEAEDKTALLNDAYRTLREPVSRAEYVLKQAGLDVAEQKNVPPELLEEVFELNMALEELRSGDEDARPQLEEANVKFQGMRDEIDRQLESQFAAYDSGSASALAEIRATINRRNYIRNLLRDVGQALACTEL